MDHVLTMMKANTRKEIEKGQNKMLRQGKASTSQIYDEAVSNRLIYIIISTVDSPLSPALRLTPPPHTQQLPIVLVESSPSN